MLIQNVDDKLSNTNMRKDTNCSRIKNNSKMKSSTSESHVDAMNNSEIGCKRRLHQSKTCGCICDGDAKSLRSNECQTSSGRSMESLNINENVQRYINQLPDNRENPGDWSCPRIFIDSTKENRHLVTVDNISNHSEEEIHDNYPVIRLSLRKPKHWRWKLTTSASSPAIILPAIQLLNEDGDLLLDTRKRSDFKNRRKRVDSNGNDNDFNPIEAQPNLLQKSKSERFNIASVKRRVDRLNNEKTSEALAADITEKQKVEMGNLLLGDGGRSMTPKGEDPDKTTGNKTTLMGLPSRCQNIICRKQFSDGDDLTVKPFKGFRNSRISRSCDKKKGQLQCRRKFETRRNWEDSSSSSDSSPKLRRRGKLKDRATTGNKGNFFVTCLYQCASHVTRLYAVQ
ncbi:hypothetical protein L9F63_012964 [Diploptera punctata]|uniref:Uncharacterized protein n=1 Tax=Diploptera punctata TaxID=6984 RepID=A0AAD8EMR2_DIPPU|nr:hypothetical protein L9F63_012964 [Diploptera punctata]